MKPSQNAQCLSKNQFSFHSLSLSHFFFIIISACICNAGFVGNGTYCPRPCESNPCQNNGTCVNGLDEHLCKCKSGFDGNNCENELMPTGSDNTNLLVGILVPVFCIFVVATFLIVYFYRKWKLIKTKSNELHQRLLNSHGFELEQGESENFFGISTFGDGRAVPETPLLNTKLEVSLPGFLKMDYKTQLEIGENIGGGGSAEIYKGVLIDQNLQMKYGFSEVAIKQIKDEANLTEEQNRIKFQQEVAILWSLDNQLNVMKLIDYSIKPRYIITKLYPTDLFKFIHTSTIEITSKMIFNLTFEISTGLTAIHAIKLLIVISKALIFCLKRFRKMVKLE